jgi:thiazole/oxazole-forming peptide maturase SagD family component
MTALSPTTFESILRDHGVITEAMQLRNAPDDLPLFFFGARLAGHIDRGLAESGQRLAAAAAAFRSEDARMAALGEAIERAVFVRWPYASDATVVSAAIQDSWLEFPLQLPSDQTDEEWFDAFAGRHTTTVCAVPSRVSQGDALPVPLGLLSCSNGDDFKVTTNGMACGPDLEWACQRAVFEVVERTAVMTAWHRDIRPVALDPASTLSADWSATVPELGHRLRLGLLMADIALPVAVAGITCKASDGSIRVVLGSACRSHVTEAADAAMREAALSLHALNERASLGRQDTPPIETWSLVDHHERYAGEKASIILDWLDSGAKLGKESLPEVGVTLSDVEHCLHAAGYRVLYFDMTPRFLKEYPSRIVRAVVPYTVPLLVGNGRPQKDTRSRTQAFQVGIQVSDGKKWRNTPHPFP